MLTHAGLVMMVAVTTGGIESLAAGWLVVVPLEAALSASRRVVAFAFALAMSCAALLIVLGHYHLLPAPDGLFKKVLFRSLPCRGCWRNSPTTRLRSAHEC